ncbi:diphthamide biosynthesis protein 4 Ecym_1110 [Eremothecium cymbalariae DBVPG|uniref:Diphthamide biosynthesis protein 4 n=1 Tax=Eremothecium cymbalariae (strain CBS 270.75 / DBVPG 7215 / KCTC 17166 / NRRL Y-17582) TaxID=931890 RepID=G8JML0_ERECY|nr:hypothetical protein Ecym_1110 [Eremothecium cymbalariae DBVPG\
MNVSHYSVLGIDSDADSDTIKKAYRRRLLETHPDKKQISNESLSVDQLQKAYRVLIDKELRAKYDSELSEGFKKQGFYITGEGLDEYSLDQFEFHEKDRTFTMNCPRCTVNEGFEFNEVMLEGHAVGKQEGGMHVVVQCNSCSLWINVNFDIVYSE